MWEFIVMLVVIEWCLAALHSIEFDYHRFAVYGPDPLDARPCITLELVNMAGGYVFGPGVIDVACSHAQLVQGGYVVD